MQNRTCDEWVGRYTKDDRTEALSKVCHKFIDVFTYECKSCGLEFHWTEDASCPMCGSENIIVVDSKTVTINIYAKDGTVEVE